MDSTTDYIFKWAKHYEVSPRFALCVALNESSYNPLAVGDFKNGKPMAHGIYQFHLSTWKQFRREMGEDEVDQRFNPNEAAKTAIWAFSKGYENHWSVVKNGLCGRQK